MVRRAGLNKEKLETYDSDGLVRRQIGLHVDREKVVDFRLALELASEGGASEGGGRLRLLIRLA